MFMKKHCWSFPHHKKVQERCFLHHSLIYNCIKHLLSFTIFKTLSKETTIKLWPTMKSGWARTRRHHRWQLPTGSAGWRRLHIGAARAHPGFSVPGGRRLWSQHSGCHPGWQMHLHASTVKALRELISQNEGPFSPQIHFFVLIITITSEVPVS